MDRRTAAILTIGSELTEGLRIDTNSAEIARALSAAGLLVLELASVGDDIEVARRLIERLTAAHDVVVTTGGLGPTHDDVTREAASEALRKPLARDERLVETLSPGAARHHDPEAAEQVLRQADVLSGAEVIDATTGTAPGLVVGTPSGGVLALLPGPPNEMRPMLRTLVGRFAEHRARPRQFGVTGMSESDTQVAAARALGDAPGVRLTVLARPGDVQVILLDEGAGDGALDTAAIAVRAALGDACYADDGSSLAASVVSMATAAEVTFAFAESCTGGLIAAAVTDVPGASACFLGGIVAYDDRVKRQVLEVDADVLERHGAVSEETARAMAEGVRAKTGADIAVSVTGIAGPGGGSADKPVGLVWFAVSTADGTRTIERRFSGGGRASVRDRASAFALDLVRREVATR